MNFIVQDSKLESYCCLLHFSNVVCWLELVNFNIMVNRHYTIK
jgi:hypothetical protein